MTFQKDLEIGQAKERLAVPLIKNHWLAFGKKRVIVWLNPNNDLAGQRLGDIFDNYGIRWEVKYDRMSKETGNVYLEHAALRRSGADYVIFFFDDSEPMFFPKDALLVLIESDKYRIANVGLGNQGTIVPFEDLAKIGKAFLKNDKKKRKNLA